MRLLYQYTWMTVGIFSHIPSYEASWLTQIVEDVLYEFVIRFNGCMLGLDYMENFSIIL